MGCQHRSQNYIQCHKERKFKFLWKILVLTAFSLLLSNSVKAQCESCHPLEVATYFHSPYEKHQCDNCHKQQSNTSNEEEVDLSKVKWFVQGRVLKGVSYIFVPRLRQNKILVFYIPKINKKFILDPQNIKIFSSSYHPILIKKIETCGIEEGIWWEANICVTFNQPAELEISCEDDIYEQKDYWSSFHQITLAGLKKNKTYNCLIKARTILGNEVETVFQFKVDKQEAPHFSIAKNVNVSLYRLDDDDVFIFIDTDGLVDWKLGELSGNPKLISVKNDSKYHKGNLDASPNLCYRCHTDHKSMVNHPINVPLKENMKKTDLPLYNGLITCLSCHEPHVAKRPYLLRKESTGLCLSCHDDRYYK